MKLVRLGDIIKITSGGTPLTSKREYYTDGTIPWVKTGDLKVRHLVEIPDTITQLGLENSSAKIFPKNTVLIAMYGATIGNCSILKTEAATNQACAALLPSEKINEEFLFFFLLSIKNELINLGVGGGQPNISATILKNIKIPLIPLSEQIQIAEILSQAEKLITERKHSLNLLDELLKSTFLEMFGDPVRNEKRWETIKFKEIAKVDRVQVTPDQINNNDFYIGLEDIEKQTGEINKKSTKNADDLKSSKFKFTNSHILYAKLRPYLNKVALPEINGICSTDIYPILPIENISNRYFICYLMRSDYFCKEMNSKATGANLPRASATAIEQFKTYQPPIELQSKFAYIAEKVDSLKSQYQQSLTELQNMYGVLIQKAFREGLNIKEVK